MMRSYHFDLAGQGEVGLDELRAKHQSHRIDEESRQLLAVRGEKMSV
jgi:hypothetical protein